LTLQPKIDCYAVGSGGGWKVGVVPLIAMLLALS